MEALRTIFMGTPDFSVPSLQALLSDDFFNIVAVITQADKKVGRQQTIEYSPIKKLAISKNLKILQPEKIKNIADDINNLLPDILIVVAYGQIIPEDILNIPKFGCINVHASLLPKHRGAACIQSAILHGDEKTGVTIMKMDKGLDTGPILSQIETQILSDDTTGTLHNKLSDQGAEILIKTIKKYIINEIKPVAQDDSRANYVGILKKDDGRINWQDDSIAIDRKIRAMSPWPNAWTTWSDKRLIIKKALMANNIFDLKPGQILIKNNELFIGCQKNAIKIIEIQISGKSPLPIKNFIAGHQNINGTILL